jgi:REP element-mobilizing transposase RayT
MIRVWQVVSAPASVNQHHLPKGVRRRVWQHQFWDRFVRTKKEFEARIEYMRLNPVQKNLVARSEDWRWSGFPDSSEPVVRVDDIYLPDDYRA